MSVPKRLPPRPHSCSTSRSPRRQRAAAKPSQVMNANSNTKMMSAVQFTSCTAFLPDFRFYRRNRPSSPLVVGGEVHGGGEHRPDDHPDQLVPVEERNADPGRLNLVVEGRPEDRDELDHEQEIPWAPSRAPCAALIHVSPGSGSRLPTK